MIGFKDGKWARMTWHKEITRKEYEALKEYHRKVDGKKYEKNTNTL